jgi:hypothetical protein
VTDLTDGEFNDAWATAMADDSKWTVIRNRFADSLDMLAELDPDDPFIQQMVATRQRIARKHEEILASVPEGLSRRERDQYVSARIMGAIGSDVAETMARMEGQ